MLVKTLIPAHGSAISLSEITLVDGTSDIGAGRALVEILEHATRADRDSGSVAGEAGEADRFFRDVQLVSPLTEDRLLSGVMRADAGDAAGGSPTGESVVAGLDPTLAAPLEVRCRKEAWSLLRRPVLSAQAVARSDLGELLRLRFAHLSGARLDGLLEPVPSGDPLQGPRRLLHLLQWAPASVLESLNAAMATLFDDIVITLDASRVVELTLRTGNAPSHADPRRQARAFASLPSLGTRSEAVRRCAAILIVCLLNKGRVLLLDSVDGGLPAHTARGLGRWLSDHQRELDAQLMIASAGSAFRSGLCSGGADVTLVRLRRHEGLIHVNAVPPDACRLLECSGIARAVGAGECLAANGILLTETDVERAIYQSLVDADVPGEHRIHVVHSLGPSTLLMMHTRLATVGVRVAVLATLDVFASSERFQEWCARLTGGAAPRAWMSTRDRLAIEMEGGPDRKTLAENTRELESFLAQLHANANETPPAMVAGTRRASDRWRELRVKGLSILSSELRPWVEELVEELKRYGLFLSPVGSVRQWFQDGRSPSGSPWIEDAMAKIERGACPEPLLASFRETITWIRMP